ncbi:unnamed protein product [Ilex paraguariensis]|uniref:Dehydrin n=1 Tax=Ilex paraguariensis TaxID=185542 RepID=A0ABC8T2M1_9AQUA
MAEYGEKYGSQGRQTDEHGNPVQHTGGTTGGGCGVGTGTGLGGGEPHQQQHHGPGGILQRSGSSSSSSSEDDGQGGRRKKGLKEKIKEKLPGGQKDDPAHSTGPGYGYEGEHHEKKGMMEKIKEKLPGQQNR